MIASAELLAIAADVGVHFSVVTLDYCQGWLLFGLSQTPLRDGLVFKGGTPQGDGD